MNNNIIQVEGSTINDQEQKEPLIKKQIFNLDQQTILHIKEFLQQQVQNGNIIAYSIQKNTEKKTILEKICSPNCKECDHNLICLSCDQNYTLQKNGLCQPKQAKQKNIKRQLLEELEECYNNRDNCEKGIFKDEETSCKNGQKGPLCEVCDTNGEFSTGNFFQIAEYECKECKFSADIIFPFILQLLLQIVLVYSSSKISIRDITNSLKSDSLQIMFFVQKPKQTLLLPIYKTLVNSVFLLSFLATLSLNLGKEIKVAMITIGNPSYMIVKYLQCVFGQMDINAPVVYFESFCLLLIMFLYIFIVFFISKMYQKYYKQLYKMQCLVASAYIFIIFQFQPLIIYKLIQGLSCRTIKHQEYIIGDISHTCYTDQYYYVAFIYLIPVLLIFTLIIPFLTYKILKKQQNTKRKMELSSKGMTTNLTEVSILEEEKQKEIKNNSFKPEENQFTKPHYLLKYGYLNLEYKNHQYYWELVKILFRSLFCIGLALANDNIIWKCSISITIIVCYIALTQWVQPYLHEQHLLLDVISNQLIILCYMAAVYLHNTDKNWDFYTACICVFFFFFGIVIMNFKYIFQRKLQDFQIQMHIKDKQEEQQRECKSILQKIQALRQPNIVGGLISGAPSYAHTSQSHQAQINSKSIKDHEKMIESFEFLDFNSMQEIYLNDNAPPKEKKSLSSQNCHKAIFKFGKSVSFLANNFNRNVASNQEKCEELREKLIQTFQTIVVAFKTNTLLEENQNKKFIPQSANIEQFISQYCVRLNHTNIQSSSNETDISKQSFMDKPFSQKRLLKSIKSKIQSKIDSNKRLSDTIKSNNISSSTKRRSQTVRHSIENLFTSYKRNSNNFLQANQINQKQKLGIGQDIKFTVSKPLNTNPNISQQIPNQQLQSQNQQQQDTNLLDINYSAVCNKSNPNNTNIIQNQNQDHNEEELDEVMSENQSTKNLPYETTITKYQIKQLNEMSAILQQNSQTLQSMSYRDKKLTSEDIQVSYLDFEQYEQYGTERQLEEYFHENIAENKQVTKNDKKEKIVNIIEDPFFLAVSPQQHRDKSEIMSSKNKTIKSKYFYKKNDLNIQVKQNESNQNIVSLEAIKEEADTLQNIEKLEKISNQICDQITDTDIMDNFIVFKLFDDENKGQLSKPKLMTNLMFLNLTVTKHRFLDIFDIIQTQTIDFIDFVSLIFYQLYAVMSSEELERVFSYFDRDQDGFIDQIDLSKMLYKLIGYEVEQDIIRTLMKEFDKDKDNKLSLKEYQWLIQ